jgi:hypothetical protein
MNWSVYLTVLSEYVEVAQTLELVSDLIVTLPDAKEVPKLDVVVSSVKRDLSLKLLSSKSRCPSNL